MNNAECPAFLDLYRAAGGGSGWTLDLGIGAGRLLPGQLDAEVGWLGFDLRRRALRQAAEQHRPNNIRVALHQGDAHALPYRGDAFSAVVSNGLLHHVAAPPIVLAEAVRVLAPSGLVLFRDLRPTGFRDGPAAPTQAGGLLSLAAMQAHVEQLGFERRTIRQAGPYWVWLARKPASPS